MKNSSLFSFNVRDLVKGFLMAIIGVVITGLYTSVQAGSFPLTWIEWAPIVKVGLGAGLAYILKNFFTNSDDKFLIKENKN